MSLPGRDGGAYPVAIVGEVNYQDAIRRCQAGERVQIVHEIGNPYDPEALAVQRLTGATIGYIARESWLRQALVDEGRGATAHILRIEGKPLGVVISVKLTDRELGVREYSAAARPRAASMPEPQGGFEAVVERAKSAGMAIVVVVGGALLLGLCTSKSDKGLGPPRVVSPGGASMPTEQLAECDRLYATIVDGVVVKRARGERIDVEEAAWSRQSAEDKTAVLSVVACHAHRAHIDNQRWDQGAVAYGYRSGKRLAMLTPSGMVWE